MGCINCCFYLERKIRQIVLARSDFYTRRRNCRIRDQLAIASAIYFWRHTCDHFKCVLCILFFEHTAFTPIFKYNQLYLECHSDLRDTAFIYLPDTRVFFYRILPGNILFISRGCAHISGDRIFFGRLCVRSPARLDCFSHHDYTTGHYCIDCHPISWRIFVDRSMDRWFGHIIWDFPD